MALGIFLPEEPATGEALGSPGQDQAHVRAPTPALSRSSVAMGLDPNCLMLPALPVSALGAIAISMFGVRAQTWCFMRARQALYL